MSTKYSTKRKKFATNNISKFGRRRIHRPDEILFNDKQRIEFVTGFRRRKQNRRIQAACELIHLKQRQKQELRKYKKNEQNECLMNGGLIDDPIIRFLHESDSDSDPKKEYMKEYANNELTITVCTSIPNQFNPRAQRFLDTQAIVEQMNAENERTPIGREYMDLEIACKNSKIHCGSNLEMNDAIENFFWNDIRSRNKEFEHQQREEQSLTIFEQRQMGKRNFELKVERKRHKRQVKKMIKFVKEYNRKKKRKANSKRCKRKKNRRI